MKIRTKLSSVSVSSAIFYETDVKLVKSIFFFKNSNKLLLQFLFGTTFEYFSKIVPNFCQLVSN